MSIIRQDYGNLADMATQQLLAPIFPTLVATKAVSKGGLFIINNTLYKATADIALNATITVGTNAALASTIAEELSSKDNNIFSPDTAHASILSTNAVVKNGNFVWMNLAFKPLASVASGTYLRYVGTVTKIPKTHVVLPAVLINDGSYAGMIVISNTGSDKNKIMFFNAKSSALGTSSEIYCCGVYYTEE